MGSNPNMFTPCIRGFPVLWLPRVKKMDARITGLSNLPLGNSAV